MGTQYGMTIAAILLAAGQSRRFGVSDKLAEPLDGVPLGLHAARTLSALPLAARFVVTRAEALAWPGFEAIVNAQPAAGLAHSIALGAAAARRVGAQAVLIALADMPFVSEAHFRRLIDLHDGPDTLVASRDGGQRMPPCLFGADWIPVLERLSGDRGARSLLREARTIAAPSGELLDIDTPQDLHTAEQLSSSRIDIPG